MSKKANPKYDDLKNKTIFDFCDDESILADIVVVDKIDYIANLQENPINNANDLLEYAQRVGDKDLRDAVKTQYRKEFKEFYGE